MKNYQKLFCFILALASATSYSFAEQGGNSEEARILEHEKCLKQVRTKCDDLFFNGENGFSEKNKNIYWRGSAYFDTDLHLIHSRMAGITNLVSAKEYLSLVETAQPLKGAYVLTFWAPELLFQLPYEEVIGYYAAMQEKKIPVPKVISEKIEKEHKNDLVLWSYKLSKFNHHTHNKTNEILLVRNILSDFDKTSPKEERKAKEKCVEARFVYLLEGPEQAADYLLKEIADEKDPNERQTLYLQAVSFYYPDRDSSQKIIKAFSTDQDIPDPVQILSRCGSRLTFYTDISVAQIWERALCAKDPGSALAAWEQFVSRYWFILKPNRKIEVAANDALQNEGAARLRRLKDIFSDYLKGEAPFKETDFFQLLSEEELKEEKKQIGREYRSYGNNEIISGRKKQLLFIMLIFDRKEELLAYGKRRAEKLAELENRFSAEDISEGDNTEEWNDFWHIYRDEAKRYGFMPLYKETLLAFIEKHPQKYQLIKNYCEVLLNEGKNKEAEDFLNKNYPEEKLINNPEELQSYAELHKYHELPFDEKGMVKKIFEFGLQNDAEALAEGNQYLWERLWKGDNRDVRKEVREKIAALPKLGPSLLKRLEEISLKEDYEAIVAEKGTESDSSENSNETQIEEKDNSKKGIDESEKSDDVVITGEWGVYYPEEVNKRYNEACRMANEPEMERWALELALLNGHLAYDDIVEKLPKAWNKKRPLLAFEQSVWYLQNSGMYLQGLTFLFDHFYREKRIPEERWLRVFKSTEHYMHSESNFFDGAMSKFSSSFLMNLDLLRPSFADHRVENAIAAFYLKISTDEYTDKRGNGTFSYIEDCCLTIYSERGCNNSSLQYLYNIFVDDRTNSLYATLGGIRCVMDLCEKTCCFPFDDLAAFSTQKVANVTLNAETIEGRDTVSRSLGIYKSLLRLAEKHSDKKVFEQRFRSAFIKSFDAFAKADRRDQYWYELENNLKYFKGNNDLTNLISVCGSIKKDRAFVLDMFIYFLLDFSSEDLAVLGGAPNYETLSKYFVLSDPAEELRKVDVNERTYTNIMCKILNAAVARNDSNEVKRINWQLETYPKIYKERQERRLREIEEREKKYEEEVDWSPYSSWDGRDTYRKQRYRDEELSREKEGEAPLKASVFDEENHWLTGNTLEDWNGKRKYLEKKWKEEAEKAKKEEDENAGNAGEE